MPAPSDGARRMTEPPGWYPDPGGSWQRRWWNGSTWTEHLAPGVQAPPRGPHRRRRWPWFVGGAVLLVGVLTAAVVVPKVVDTFAGSIRGANTYLDALRDGRTRDAYDLLCAELRARRSYEDYLAAIESESSGERLVAFNANGANAEVGSDFTTVDIAIRTTNGNAAIQARMAKEDGDWRWCGARPEPESREFRIPFP